MQSKEGKSPIAQNNSESAPQPLIVVSNRLPVRLTIDSNSWSLERSSGGLATAVAGVVSEDTLWVGWPGAAVPSGMQHEVRDRMEQDGLYPVFLDEGQEDSYYRGFCNTVLWPLLHYFTSTVQYSDSDWRTYVEVNEHFAEIVAEKSPRGARVWVHDFHLMLVPRMLRVGESTGGLDTSLLNIAYFYNRDVDESMERVQQMIMPAMTVMVGSVLIWVIVSVYGPIYDLIATLGI